MCSTQFSKWQSTRSSFSPHPFPSSFPVLSVLALPLLRLSASLFETNNEQHIAETNVSIVRHKIAFCFDAFSFVVIVLPLGVRVCVCVSSSRMAQARVGLVKWVRCSQTMAANNSTTTTTTTANTNNNRPFHSIFRIQCLRSMGYKYTHIQCVCVCWA